MKKYRWNEPNSISCFWDTHTDSKFEELRSHIDNVRHPGGIRFEDLLRSLSKVVVELVEIEESRLDLTKPNDGYPSDNKVTLNALKLMEQGYPELVWNEVTKEWEPKK